MPNLPWIKLYTEIIDDPKLYRLTDALKWRFVQLLALAGECDSEGYLCTSIAPLGPADIALRLRVDPALLLSDLQSLAQLRLVVLDETVNAWMIPSFAIRQSRPDDRTRLYWREKKRRQRSASASPRAVDPAGNDFEERDDSEPGSDSDGDPSGAKAADNVSDHVPETVLENVPLKRRKEQRRGDERRKEERQKPPPPSRPAVKSRSPASVLDQLENELSQKKN